MDESLSTVVATYDPNGNESLLLQTEEARIESLAATDHLLVAVLRFDDGSRRLHRLQGWPTP